jgi:hypothetical protein
MPKVGDVEAWADTIRRLEAETRQWAYELGEANTSTADLARRTQAQTVGLRRLLDQMAMKETQQ